MSVFPGTVVSVDSQGHPSVQIAPQTATPAVSGSYPAPGDVVWLLVDGTSMSWLPAPQPATSAPPPPPPPPPPPTDGVYWGGTADLTDTTAWPDRVLMPAPLPIPSGAVAIPAGANIAQAVSSHPAGTVFALAAGSYDGGSGTQVFPLAGQQFYGAGAGRTVLNNVWFHRQDASRSGVGIFNLTVKGCVSQSGPFAAHLAAIDSNFHESAAASGWHVANCEIAGNYMGLSLGPNSVVENCTIHDNLAKGMAGGMTNPTVRFCQFYRNMQPGASGWFDTGGDNGGVKHTVMNGGTFTGNLYHRANPNGAVYGGIGGPGLWMDVSCGLTGDHVSASPSTGNAFSGNLIFNNYGSGICDETGGNNTFTGNLIAGNGKGARLDPWRAAGLVIQSSNHDSVSGNYVWGNPASITVYLDQSGNDRADARRSMANTVTGNWCDVAPSQLTGMWSGGAGGNTIANNTVLGGLVGVNIPKVKAGPQALAA